MAGYRVTKIEAERFVVKYYERKLMAMKYIDKHNQYPKDADYGVWDLENSHWVWIE